MNAAPFFSPPAVRRCVFAALAFLVLAPVPGAFAADEVLRLTGGPAQRRADGVYRGIPYAAPPVGERRWKPPAPPVSWTDPREFDAYGPVCPQPTADGDPMSEDCLTLNVTAPAEASPAGSGNGLPVMVFFHGGSFIGGAGSLSLYEGENLVDRGVILVTVNYRLGPLGYLAHPLLSAESPDGVSGNYGLLDQIAALTWVRDNIAAFGGDPAKVTIFGQSAGAESVCLLLVSPLARGLFRAAIAESPVMTGSLRPLRTSFLDKALALGPRVRSAEELGLALAEALGADKAPDVLAAMRAASYEELIKSGSGLWRDYGLAVAGLVYGPAVDGVAIPDHPVRLMRGGAWNAVPVMTGTTADESAIFLPGLDPSLATPEGLAAYAAASFGPEAGARLLSVLDAGPGDAKSRLVRLLNASWFGAWDVFFADEAAKAGQPVHVYRFARPLPQGALDVLTDEADADSLDAGILGVPHSAELFSVFGFTSFLLGFDGEDEAVSRDMAGYWTSFAKTGDPNDSGTPGAPGEAKPAFWPLLTPGEKARVLSIGETIAGTPRAVDPLVPLIQATWLDTTY